MGRIFIPEEDYIMKIGRDQECHCHFGPIKERVEANRDILRSIAKTLLTCAQQNVPIRGKTEERSNVSAFLRLSASHTVTQHIVKGPRNAQYKSPLIQNELLDLMAKQVQESIIRECKAVLYFSILANETADVNNTMQVSLSLRYADSTFQVQEKLVTFASTEATTGEALALAGLITSTIMDLDLDLENLVGQGYDGAGFVAPLFIVHYRLLRYTVPLCKLLRSADRL
ncbi:uncharacterized protein LOC106166494 [Lingula anatina]|uniref:Uncharacterized protein LOC106166494 n=1 Tax=Lingula anatina TaxID=7574 RepID=A0A1S3ISL4_LINAN|nr:uncharacterized protein LOC106166494 [Lingula anatina]|eukprot:XP_013400524.1 uncharacterized protein LOC106166494 [Lingula anatina]